MPRQNDLLIWIYRKVSSSSLLSSIDSKVDLRIWHSQDTKAPKNYWHESENWWGVLKTSSVKMYKNIFWNLEIWNRYEQRYFKDVVIHFISERRQKKTSKYCR